MEGGNEANAVSTVTLSLKYAIPLPQPKNTALLVRGRLRPLCSNGG
ncbi:MAG: hypothetical protein IJQ39_14835 [Thermoguttaceae bacterium]|nr:hypothetical protein [Thermoguttaceae bacterium]